MRSLFFGWTIKKYRKYADAQKYVYINAGRNENDLFLCLIFNTEIFVRMRKFCEQEDECFRCRFCRHSAHCNETFTETENRIICTNRLTHIFFSFSSSSSYQVMYRNIKEVDGGLNIHRYYECFGDAPKKYSFL